MGFKKRLLSDRTIQPATRKCAILVRTACRFCVVKKMSVLAIRRHDNEVMESAIKKAAKLR